MANAHRGEISAVFDGKPYTLCLTLGALAELEDAFGATDMLAVAERFSSGRISASDCIRIITVGLNAAGHDNIDGAQVASMKTGQGAAGYVQVVASLLSATFGAESMTAPGQPQGAAKKQPGKSHGLSGARVCQRTGQKKP